MLLVNFLDYSIPEKPHTALLSDQTCNLVSKADAAHATVQLEFLDPLMAWLAEQNVAPGGFAEGKLDLNRVGVAGHSRGGKLAALHFVGARF